MKKLKQLKCKKKSWSSKKKLANINVKGESQCKRICYVLDGNRKIKDLKIDDELLNSDKDELIDLLIISFNKAIEDADYVNENELKNTALNVFPEIGK